MTTRTRSTLLRGIQALASVFLLEAEVWAASAGEWGGQWVKKGVWYSTPDTWDFFGGHAAISVQPWKQDGLALQPIGAIYGADLAKNSQVQEALETQFRLRPRLVIVAFPCGYWSQLTRLHSRTNSRRQSLKKHLAKHGTFLQLSETPAFRQMGNGDGFLFENPVTSLVLNQPR